MPRAGTIDRGQKQPPPIVYLSIGNSDDKLTQQAWSDYVAEAETLAVKYAMRIHGNWRSKPDDPWQNACWCYEAWPHLMDEARLSWAKLAARYGQDSVAFAIAPTTEFLGPQWLAEEGFDPTERGHIE